MLFNDSHDSVNVKHHVSVISQTIVLPWNFLVSVVLLIFNRADIQFSLSSVYLPILVMR